MESSCEFNGFLWVLLGLFLVLVGLDGFWWANPGERVLGQVTTASVNNAPRHHGNGWHASPPLCLAGARAGVERSGGKEGKDDFYSTFLLYILYI